MEPEVTLAILYITCIQIGGSRLVLGLVKLKLI
jgi:hypothetical protein